MLPYVSRDVATEPPTTVVIVPVGGPPADFVKGDEAIFAISENCVEPTEGWLNREGKPLLTICFMHSFGKCAGRTNSDPRSCFQIHVNPKVLNALRRHYTNPTRQFFTRSVKAQLSPELRHQLSLIARKELKVQYLEYRVQDTFPSTGLLQYEAAYRRWLFEEGQTTDSSSSIAVMQCPLFATTGSCPSGSECPFIHASPKNAQVRDPVLGRALRELGESVGGIMWANGAVHPSICTNAEIGSAAKRVPTHHASGKLSASVGSAASKVSKDSHTSTPPDEASAQAGWTVSQSPPQAPLRPERARYGVSTAPVYTLVHNDHHPSGCLIPLACTDGTTLPDRGSQAPHAHKPLVNGGDGAVGWPTKGAVEGNDWGSAGGISSNNPTGSSGSGSD